MSRCNKIEVYENFVVVNNAKAQGRYLGESRQPAHVLHGLRKTLEEASKVIRDLSSPLTYLNLIYMWHR